MEVLSQLPKLFKDMEGDAGAQLMQGLMKFFAVVNQMDPDTVTAFYQALCMLQNSRKEKIFSKSNEYKNLESLKKVAVRRMAELLHGQGGAARSALISKFQKAYPEAIYLS